MSNGKNMIECRPRGEPQSERAWKLNVPGQSAKKKQPAHIELLALPVEAAGRAM
jgi:hypothetical protein